MSVIFFIDLNNIYMVAITKPVTCGWKQEILS